MEYYYQSPVGMLEIKADDTALTGLRIVENTHCWFDRQLQFVSYPVVRETCRQLNEYFAGKRNIFELPLAPKGTSFQRQVWKALLRIPYGKTTSYAALAETVGNPKASRAVGSANGKNPIAIIIPCHRVINANGQLGGYAYGLDIKKQLLDLEQKN